MHYNGAIDVRGLTAQCSCRLRQECVAMIALPNAKASLDDDDLAVGRLCDFGKLSIYPAADTLSVVVRVATIKGISDLPLELLRTKTRECPSEHGYR